MILKFALRKSN